MEILIDPRYFKTPTGFGIAVGEGPGGVEDNPHIWAISSCCARPIHFRYRGSGVQYHACSWCDSELKYSFNTSGASLAHNRAKDIQALVRQWTGMDELEVSVDI